MNLWHSVVELHLFLVGSLAEVHEQLLGHTNFLPKSVVPNRLMSMSLVACSCQDCPCKRVRLQLDLPK